jgi:NADH-quinone oxidoreductase subunit H
MRYDQFMKMGWKVLIPVSLVWIVAVAAVRVFRSEGVDLSKVLIGVAVVLALLVLIYLFLPEGRRGSPLEPEAVAEELDDDEPGHDGQTDPQAVAAARRTRYTGGYPVPPLPGETADQASSAEKEPTGV